MKGVALSLPKPPGSSLVPLHMTWLSFFESISSSTLAPWIPAKGTESKQGRREHGSCPECGMIRAGRDGGVNKGGQMEGA